MLLLVRLVALVTRRIPICRCCCRRVRPIIILSFSKVICTRLMCNRCLIVPSVRRCLCRYRKLLLIAMTLLVLWRPGRALVNCRKRRGVWWRRCRSRLLLTCVMVTRLVSRMCDPTFDITDRTLFRCCRLSRRMCWIYATCGRRWRRRLIILLRIILCLMLRVWKLMLVRVVMVNCRMC